MKNNTLKGRNWSLYLERQNNFSPALSLSLSHGYVTDLNWYREQGDKHTGAVTVHILHHS